MRTRYYEITNLTKYSESRVMYVSCPVCWTRFSRPPSHLSRASVSTCSRACAAEARVVRVSTECVICGKEMSMIPSDVGKVTTCSTACSTLRRIKLGTRKTSFAKYQKAAKRIRTRGSCQKCGTNCGPWVIRGMTSNMQENGTVTVNESGAELWCRHCHLKDIAHLGAPARGKI